MYMIVQLSKLANAAVTWGLSVPSVRPRQSPWAASYKLRTLLLRVATAWPSSHMIGIQYHYIYERVHAERRTKEYSHACTFWCRGVCASGCQHNIPGLVSRGWGVALLLSAVGAASAILGGWVLLRADHTSRLGINRQVFSVGLCPKCHRIDKLLTIRS